MTHAAPPPLLGIQDDAALAAANPLTQKLLGQLSPGVVRLQVIWPGPGKTFNFKPIDQIVENAADVGAEPLITISAGRPNTSGTGFAPATNTNATAFGDFCSQVALRYDGDYVPDDAATPLSAPASDLDPDFGFTGADDLSALPEVDRFSVLNEPNRGQYVWPQGPKGTNAPRIAARLMNACMPAIQDANPAAQVALGPLASRGAQGGLPPLEFLSAYYWDGGPEPDAIALNPYLEGLAPVYVPNDQQPGGAITLRNLNQLEALAQSYYGRSVDVWLTEFAWRVTGSVSPQKQARLTAQTLKLVDRFHFVKVFTWFLLKDAKGYWSSGLVAPNGKPRPAFNVWKQFEARSLASRSSSP
jgi:hypothetical protein